MGPCRDVQLLRGITYLSLSRSFMTSETQNCTTVSQASLCTQLMLPAAHQKAELKRS